VTVGTSSGGQWPLRAVPRGILQVNVPGLAAVNGAADLSVYTLFDGQVVEAGETVARAKIIPFAVPEDVIASGEARALASAPVVAVRGFQHKRVSALVQESLGARAVERFKAVFGEKVTWFGGALEEPVFVAPETTEVARTLGALLAGAPDLLVVAGSRTMDPLDAVFAALESSGATLVRRGMPAHPGSLCWVAQREATTIVGMPSCGVFSQATVFDLLLTWVFADVPLDAARLAQFGHGGFLTRDMAFRFPPYRQAADRGEVE
jgi:molybdopterin biosynthesis enzyme